MTEDERKYLDFLEAAVGRMGANSFALKGWSVGFGTVIIGLTAKDGQPALAWIALVPVLAFWFLDGYYLTLEREFRTLYERAAPAVRTLRHNASAAPALYDLHVGTPSPGASVATALSPSVAFVHGALVVIALLVMGWGIARGPAPTAAAGAPTASTTGSPTR